MNDRELLELAAKAAGIEPGRVGTGADTDGVQGKWNPLTDDGDALRLAVKLGFNIDVWSSSGCTIVSLPGGGVETVMHRTSATECDPYAATRRAIVRAAAEIGRMK